MDTSKWKKFKKSGTFYRNKRKFWKGLEKLVKESSKNESSSVSAVAAVLEVTENFSSQINTIQEIETSNWVNELSDEENDENYDDAINNFDFRADLQNWAVTYNISHSALKSLLQCLSNTALSRTLPLDPRTLLQTPTKLDNIRLIGNTGGIYWHQGLKLCLQNVFFDIDKSHDVSLNINMDGLPLFRSSRHEFWPILVNLHGQPECGVMVAGIYCGVGKPSNLEEFLHPFVDELKHIMQNGIIINGHKINVGIRCFICDSPARSFIKGIVYFNSTHGCQKCTVIGEYDHNSRVMTYPRLHCPKRTDRGFRSRDDVAHHKCFSPIEELNVDMITQFPVADSLHLLDLGVMKRLLQGWTGGIPGFSVRWAYRTSTLISEFLRSCKMPKEIHRAVRGLDDLANWKGLEFRTFLLYISIVILKDHLPKQYYDHFLQFFCSVTICTCLNYSDYLDLAQILLHDFIENYISLYGNRYITSNIHNLIHLVDDVRHLGILPTFSSYPFESKLYQIKRLLRNGNHALAQVAKRISEWNVLNKSKIATKRNPKMCKENNGGELKTALPQCNRFFLKIELDDGFVLYSEEFQNQWFLTKSNEIVKMKNSIFCNNQILLYGSSLKDTTSFFEFPIESSKLNIYSSNCVENLPDLYELNAVKSKMVPIKYKGNEVVFLPLLHTCKSND